MFKRRIRRLAALLTALVMLGGIADCSLPLPALAEQLSVDTEMAEAQDMPLTEAAMKAAEDEPVEAAATAMEAAEDIPLEAPEAAMEAAEDARIKAPSATMEAAEDVPLEASDAMETAEDIPLEASKETMEAAEDIPLAEAEADAAVPEDSGAENSMPETIQPVMALAYSYAVRSVRDPLAETALPIIINNEGSYSSVNADDNGALSVGKIQWHAGRALSLMRRIVALDAGQAYEILGDALYNEITGKSTSWAARIVNSDEKSRLSKLLGTPEGKQAQDDQALDDVSGYLKHGREKGIISEGALIYFADVENQNGAGGSGRIGNAAVYAAGDAKKVTLDLIHQIALADEKVGRYATRRNRTYNKIKALGLKEVDGPKVTIAPTPSPTPTPAPELPEVEGIHITDVEYPKTYVINNVGYTVRSGVIQSDAELASLTIDIQDASGKSIDSMPKTLPLSGKVQYLSRFDNDIPFSRIKTPGQYSWILIAEDTEGRSAVKKMSFTAVSSGTTAAPVASPTVKPTASPTAKPTATPVPVVKVDSIKLSKTSLSLAVGEAAALSAKLSPDDAEDKTVDWFSSNEDVATVFGGHVLGVGTGKAIITCASNDGGAEAQCSVTVGMLPEKMEVIVPEGCLGLGESVQLNVRFSPEGSSAALEWRSKNSKIASIDENGVVTGKKLGTTTLYVESENGLEDSLKVKVVEPDVVAAVILSRSGTVTLNLGDTLQLDAALSPSTAESKLKWSSSAGKYAKVDADGLVTAKKVGTATITVKADNGKKDTVKIKVVDPNIADKVVLEESGTITLGIGEELQLNAAVEPATAETELKWSSSNTKYAKVDADGLVTAKKIGTATITVKTDNGKKDTVKIKVVDPYAAEKVVLDKSGTVTIEIGETLQLNAAVEPDTAKTELKWSSSSSRAKVNQEGLVTGVRTGSVTITVKTDNGKTDTVKIKVVKAS